MFVPQCREDGGYQASQCHGSTGFCWCVDEYGNELTGARVRGPLNCSGKLHILFIHFSIVKKQIYLVNFPAKTWYFQCENKSHLHATSHHSQRKWNGLVFYYRLYSKLNIRWPFGDAKFIFLCRKIFHSFFALICEIVLHNRRDVSAGPCKILYFFV